VIWLQRQHAVEAVQDMLGRVNDLAQSPPGLDQRRVPMQDLRIEFDGFRAISFQAGAVRETQA
jgi:hypothetical protein